MKIKLFLVVSGIVIALLIYLQYYLAIFLVLSCVYNCCIWQRYKSKSNQKTNHYITFLLWIFFIFTFVLGINLLTDLSVYDDLEILKYKFIQFKIIIVMYLNYCLYILEMDFFSLLNNKFLND